MAAAQLVPGHHRRHTYGKLIRGLYTLRLLCRILAPPARYQPIFSPTLSNYCLHWLCWLRGLHRRHFKRRCPIAGSNSWGLLVIFQKWLLLVLLLILVLEMARCRLVVLRLAILVGNGWQRAHSVLQWQLRVQLLFRVDPSSCISPLHCPGS